MAINRLRIGKQFELSAVAGSIISTDGTLEPYYLSPGTNGHVLTVVAGVPTYAAPVGTVAQHDLRTLVGGQVERGSDSATLPSGAGFLHDSYSHLLGFSDNWIGTAAALQPVVRIQDNGLVMFNTDGLVNGVGVLTLTFDPVLNMLHSGIKSATLVPRANSVAIGGTNNLFFTNSLLLSTGSSNDISGITSSYVGTGGSNIISAATAMLLGTGSTNTVSGTSSFMVSTGATNTATSNNVLVLTTGSTNIGSGSRSLTLGTGSNNTSSGIRSMLISNNSSNVSAGTNSINISTGSSNEANTTNSMLMATNNGNTISTGTATMLLTTGTGSSATGATSILISSGSGNTSSAINTLLVASSFGCSVTGQNGFFFGSAFGTANLVSGIGAGIVGAGGGNTASGNFSVVVSGFECISAGDNSFTTGERHFANSYGQFVCGLNNVNSAGTTNAYVADDHIFNIGNSTSAGKSNAMTVLKSGHTQINTSPGNTGLTYTKIQVKPKAALEVVSGTQGFIPPMLTSAQATTRLAELATPSFTKLVIDPSGATNNRVNQPSADYTGDGVADAAGYYCDDREGEMWYNVELRSHQRITWSNITATYIVQTF